MTDSFEITVDNDNVSVATEFFTLVFGKEQTGITSFKYETAGVWHEGVESENNPPILFAPHFIAPAVPGGVLYPSGGYQLQVAESLPWFVRIVQSGYMRNPSIPDSTNYPVTLTWSMWPSGKMYCHASILNASMYSLVLIEEAYRLNPVDDPDINLRRDDPPNLRWFGFYSSNTGGSSGDCSHDCIVSPFQPGLDRYGTDENTNRIFVSPCVIAAGVEILRDFMLRFSANGSPGDCSDSSTFHSLANALGSDYRSPDPINGNLNAGQVIVGTKDGDGFDEGQGDYTVRAV